MNDLDKRRNRIETIVKVAAVCVAGFFFAPVALITIKGVVSLVVVAALALLVVNVGIPWLAVNLANWRLKAIEAAVAANPIETLENLSKDKHVALENMKEGIKKGVAVAQRVYEQIEEHDRQFPNNPSPRRADYLRMKQRLEFQKDKYRQTSASLEAFDQMIEEKRSDWEIAKSMNQADNLLDAGQKFQNKLMEDTAVRTVQDSLNMAFAELETACLDQPPAAPTVTVLPADQKQLPERALAGPPTMDEFDTKPDPVPVQKKRA